MIYLVNLGLAVLNLIGAAWQAEHGHYGWAVFGFGVFLMCLDKTKPND